MKLGWKQMAVTCGGVGALLIGQAVAQVQNQQPDQQRQQLEQQRRQAQQAHGEEKKICLGSDLKEMTVKDAAGQPVGQIEDLVIDTSGRIRYLAISASGESQRPGQDATDRTEAQRRQQQQQQQQQQEQQRQQQDRATAQSGEKLTLIPWDMAEFEGGESQARPGQPQPGQSQAQASIKLKVQKEQLKEAPSFTKQQLKSQTGQEQMLAQVDSFFSEHRRGAARPELQQRQQQQRQQQQPQPKEKEQDN